MHTFLRSTLVALAFVAVTAPLAPAAGPITVLVTNDDGVGAPGIDAMVEALDANPNLNVVVYAPLTNQSGTSDSFTTSGTLAVSSTTTASGYPATAVDGFPADAVLYGILAGLPAPPDLVVSGINFAQNIAELTELSGTVGAATWGARSGVPGIAVSQGIPPSPTTADYQRTAAYVAQVVERFRLGGRSRFFERKGLKPPIVLNINAPTCGSATKGVAIVPLGQSTKVTGYTGSGNVTPVVSSQSPFAVNCSAPLLVPATDLDGLTSGFVTVTPLGINRTVNQSLKSFRFLLKLPY
jgi:5'-nucleotidase